MNRLARPIRFLSCSPKVLGGKPARDAYFNDWNYPDGVSFFQRILVKMIERRKRRGAKLRVKTFALLASLRSIVKIRIIPLAFQGHSATSLKCEDDGQVSTIPVGAALAVNSRVNIFGTLYAEFKVK